MALSRIPLSASLLILLSCASPSFGQSASFYKGKTITIVVGMSAGGGYDAYARAVARRLSAHVPGSPNVIVQNMPGAGSYTAVLATETTLAKDGTVLLSFDPGLITQSMVQPDKVKVDFRKFAWVGVVTPDFRVCYGYGPNGVRSWGDLMSRRQFVIGATGRASGGFVNAATLKDVMHAPVKQVLGFPGSAELRLAIEQGELDGDCGAFSSIPSDWVRGKKAHPFVRFTRERSADIPEEAVFINDIASTQEQRQLLDVLDSPNEVGRSLVMSNEAPAYRIEIMQAAFDATMRDPEFLEDMKRLRLPVNPLTGRDAANILKGMLAASTSIVAKAKEFYD